jgi:hypothetical protein
LALCTLVALPATARGAEAPAPQGQNHVAEQSALDTAVQQHVARTDQDRETVRLFLQRADVRTIAGKAGVDMHRADAAVAAMTPREAASMAAQARQAEQALGGGASSVTISTTTIIIGLLVLILLIVALR